MNEMDLERHEAPKSLPVYAKRRDRLRELMRAAGYDCLLIAAPADRFYLSGFELHDSQPDESSGCLVICSDGRDWLATDSRYKLAAEALWNPDDILIYRGAGIEQIARLLAKSGILIGVGANDLSFGKARALRRELGRKRRLLPCPPLVSGMREIKSGEEIASLRKSFKLNHAMFAWLDSQIHAGNLAGISEAALAWEIEKFFRSNGAQELAFATIVAAGKNGALPHAVPRGDIQIGECPLLVDAGCRVDNYCSDQTRSCWVGGEPVQEFANALRLVQDAQAAALAIMKPGVPCARVYEVARDVFVKAGMQDAFTHGLGHGVGLQTHEAPSLSPSSRQILKEGMTVTVEPGLYFPEWGGVRWEHTVIVEKDGIAIL